MSEYTKAEAVDILAQCRLLRESVGYLESRAREALGEETNIIPLHQVRIPPRAEEAPGGDENTLPRREGGPSLEQD